MSTSVLAGLFQSGYLVLIPVILGVFLMFAIFMIPSLMVPDAKPVNVAQAISCYLMKTLGIVLIAMAVLPMVYNLITGNLPSMTVFSSMIIGFFIGVGILIHFSRIAMTIDEASVVVPRLIFSHVFEFLGALIVLASAISLLSNFVLYQNFGDWELSASLLLLGILMMLSFSVHIGEKKRRHLQKMGKARKK